MIRDAPRKKRLKGVKVVKTECFKTSKTLGIRNNIKKANRNRAGKLPVTYLALTTLTVTELVGKQVVDSVTSRALLVEAVDIVGTKQTVRVTSCKHIITAAR